MSRSTFKILFYVNKRLSWDEPRLTANHGQTRQNEDIRQEPNQEQYNSRESSFSFPSLGLFDTNNPVYDPAEEEFRRRMQRKKKKRGPRL